MGACAFSKQGKKVIVIQTDNSLLDRLTPTQIKMLKLKFQQFESKGGLNLDGFKKLMPYITKLPPNLIENAYFQFGGTTKTRITWLQFCSTVSQYILGSREEKCKFLYNVFDKNSKGLLSKENAKLMEKHILVKSKSLDLMNKGSSTLLSNFGKASDTIDYNDFRKWAIDNVNLHKAIQPFEIIPSGSTEKEIIMSYLAELLKGLKVGETYYVISREWLEAWKDYVKYDDEEGDAIDQDGNILIPAMKNGFDSIIYSARPVDIDNMVILDPEINIKLKPNLIENKDYEIINKQAWTDLQKWYGGGPEITREALAISNHVYVEAYPPVFKVFLKQENTLAVSKKPEIVLVSKSKPVSAIMESLKQYIIPEPNYSLFLQCGDNFIKMPKGALISSLPISDINICKLDTIQLNDFEQIAFEVEASPFNCFDVNDVVEYNSKQYWIPGIIHSITSKELIIKQTWQKKLVRVSCKDIHKIRKPAMSLIHAKSKIFSAGLTNLGNTCYMNSILQSLFHSPLINEFFLGPSCTQTITQNNTSPFIKIAEEMVKLCTEMHSTKQLKILPTEFFETFSELNKSFDRGRQHDSHEFLVVILNDLHEALSQDTSLMNTTMTLNSMSNNDELQLSRDQWDLYRGIKGSVISAVFGSQTKNTLICSRCAAKKTIFEVFNYFSLPIPVNIHDFTVSVTLVKLHSNFVQSFAIKLSTRDPLEVFLGKLATLSQVPVSNLIFGYASKGMCNRLFQPLTIDEVLSRQKMKLYAFETISSIETAEKVGKLTLWRHEFEDWRSKLVPGDLVDVHHGDRWKVGHIKEVLDLDFLVTLHQKTIQKKAFPKFSEELACYRSHTSSCNKILQIPVSHLKKQKDGIATFGTPHVLSIGCWYTWQDLVRELQSLSGHFIDNQNSASRKFHYFMYRNPNNICAICNKPECKNCKIAESYEILEELAEDSENLYVLCYWADDLLYNEIVVDHEEAEEVINIHDCFAKFIEKEIIEMRCENCGNLTHESFVELWKLPDLLIVHLKKFSFSGADPKKINVIVNFPLKGLDMSNHMLIANKEAGNTMSSAKENSLYDLYAVVNHMGTISSGHYTSYCKTEKDDWMLFDDDRVFELHQNIEKELVTNKAYILFYQRQRFRSGNILKTMSLSY